MIHVCDRSGTVCDMSGTVCDMSGTVCDMSGTVCDRSGTVCDMSGTVCYGCSARNRTVGTPVIRRKQQLRASVHGPLPPPQS